MRTIVCVKQVPASNEVRLDEKTNTIIRDGGEAVINPFDSHALEAALALKEQLGGTVAVLSMGIPAFAAKGEGAAAEGGKDMHRAGGKPGGGGNGPGQRQLHHKICAAENGGFRPDMAGENGVIAPLDEIAGHTADKKPVRTLPRAGKMVEMAGMEGIVFTYDSGDIQKIPSFL